jgi:DNA-binding response OmpR family regulator
MDNSLKKVLIIDDDSVYARTLLDRFEYDGIIAEYAANATEGVELFKKNPPSLVLLDQIMPNMDGLHVLTQIRQEIGDTETPIIMLTALGQVDLMRKAKAFGVTGFLVKGGLSPKELVLHIQSFFLSTKEDRDNKNSKLVS